MVKKNKVVVISENRWEHARGGAELQLHLQKRFLRKRGHRVSHISVGAQRGSFLKPRSFVSKHLFGECDIFYFIPLLKLLLNVRPRLVIHRDLSSLCLAGLVYCVATKTKFLLQIAHEKDYTPSKSSFHPFSIFEHYLRRRILKKATLITAQTDDQLKALKLLDVSGEAFVMRNVVASAADDLPRHHELADITIAWIANIKADKNLAELIQFSRFFEGNKKVKFLVIGKNYGDKNTQTLLEEIDERRNIEYLGYLKADEINEILRSVQFLCTTSVREGFPNVFLQAWSYGIPVISTGIDPDGVIKRHVLGLCDSDLMTLARLTLNLAEDWRSYSKISDACIEHVHRYHSEENFTELHNLLGAE